jgi:hypothetical protein
VLSGYFREGCIGSVPMERSFAGLRERVSSNWGRTPFSG